MAKEGLAPKLLAEQTKQSVVQLAWGGRGVEEQSLYFELFLERHKCEMLLLELHPRGLEEDVFDHPLDEFRYLSRLDNSTIRRHLTRHCGWWQVQVWRWVPMWAWAEFSTQVGWHDVLAWRRGELFEPNKVDGAGPGEVQTRSAVELEEQRKEWDKEAKQHQLDAQSVEQFREIIELCERYEVQCVAVFPGVWGDEQWREKALKVYSPLLGAEAAIFIPKGEYLRHAESYQDAFHLNASGAKAWTLELSRFLKDEARTE